MNKKRFPRHCFKPADISSFGASDDETHYVAEYTRIQACVVEGAPDAHTAWLVVGVQHFCVSSTYLDSAEEASWMCLQLGKALPEVYLRERERNEPCC